MNLDARTHTHARTHARTLARSHAHTLSHTQVSAETGGKMKVTAQDQDTAFSRTFKNSKSYKMASSWAPRLNPGMEGGEGRIPCRDARGSGAAA